MTDATKLIEYPADVKATIDELKSAFIDVTIHAQQAFKLVALIEQQAKEIEDARRTAEYWKAEHNAANARIAELESAAKATVPEGCTPADAAMLREANHRLAAENDSLRRALKPFADLVSTDRLSWAMVEYQIDGDPEKQTFQRPQMQRAFNRAADLYRVPDAPTAALAQPLEAQADARDARDAAELYYALRKKAEQLGFKSIADVFDAANGEPCTYPRCVVVPRDFIGQIVRDAWVKWAQTQLNPKASWLLPYAELSEADKEADRQIGEAVVAWVTRMKGVEFEADRQIDAAQPASSVAEGDKQ